MTKSNETSPPPKVYGLSLANGSEWRLTAGDPGVAPFVERFAAVCSMDPSPSDAHGEIFYCSVHGFDDLDAFRRDHPEFLEYGRGRFFRYLFDPSHTDGCMFFNLDEYRNAAMRILAIGAIGDALQLQLLSRGNCAPCHCALVEIDGRGAVIGGAGDSGKTTCARRIPPPHRALADDYALLFVHEGALLAQAMPTWSRLSDGDSGYVADCSQVVDVDAFFFLRCGADDFTEPLEGGRAVVQLNAVLQDLLCVRTVVDMPDGVRETRRSGIFSFAEQLVRWKPAWHLHASLHGDFWNPMQTAMGGGAQQSGYARRGRSCEILGF